jgi:glycerol uptake facilitator-like aquaporin
MKRRVVYVQTTCFLEQSPAIGLARRASAEGVGTLLLVIAAAGSGQAFQRLVPESPALALIATAIATAAALGGLVLGLGAVSGGHFIR